MAYIYNVSKRVEKIIKNCIRKLNELKIEIAETISFSENEGYSYYGTCTMNDQANKKEFAITINKYLIYDKDIKETVIHELLHTINGCEDHKSLWKQYADIVNEKFNINVLVSSNYELEKEAYINRKAFSLLEYDSENMIIVECPICHEKIALKKNMIMGADGSTGYWCKKCHKPYYYNLRVDNQENHKNIVLNVLNNNFEYTAESIINALPYIEKELCDELLIYFVKNEINIFTKERKNHLALNLRKFSTREGKHKVAKMYIDGELDNILTGDEKEENAFTAIFSLTNDYVKVCNHYRNRYNKKY